MSQSQLLIKTVTVLEAARVPYMLTGSFASSLQGEPRLTHDIDLVVQLNPSAVDALMAGFPTPDYYLDSLSILEASSGDKVDFWLLTNDPFDQSRFARRYLDDFEGHPLYVSRPEDTIVMKLRWAKMCGGSRKQLGDVAGIYHLQSDLLEIPYIEKWVDILELSDLWEKVKQNADLDESP